MPVSASWVGSFYRDLKYEPLSKLLRLKGRLIKPHNRYYLLGPVYPSWHRVHTREALEALDYVLRFLIRYRVRRFIFDNQLPINIQDEES